MRILHYCQHVLGMGHFFRSLEIARALENHAVTLVTGGPEVQAVLPPHVRHEQLPGLRMDENFSTLLPSEGQQHRDLDTIRLERAQRLLELMRECRPQVFLVELFPFGRRQFSFELVPALEAARAGRFGPCRTVSSVRDILVEKKDQTRYETRVLKLLNRLFDLVLVHADPNLVSLERTFSRLEQVRPPLAYTGYVAPRSASEDGSALRRELGIHPEERLVLVSAGSGSVGRELLGAALEATLIARESAPLRLCLFSGPLLAENAFQALAARAAPLPWARVARFTTRFPAYLAAADLSISLGGYNTVMNLLAAKTFGLVLPFHQNREQGMRADLLQERGLLRVLSQKDLDPIRLADLLLESLQRPPRQTTVNLQGAATTARCLERLGAPKPRGAVRRTVCQPWLQTPLREREALWDDFFHRLGRLRAAHPHAAILFRADDVAVPGRNLERVLEVFLRAERPLLLAVVPAWLRQDHWRELLRTSRDAPLFTWGQHGWRHADHEACGRKNEFPPGRALVRKRADLLKGHERLLQIMGPRFTPVFTPPWNRMDQDSLELLPELGFEAISADTKLLPRAPDLAGRLDFYPVHVDLHTRREQTPATALEGMLAEFARSLAQGSCGVMLHHQRMAPASFDFLERLLGTI
jgi:predicted glycosyltransferase/peptidoglycan/xylan/chitin deacetylase (PgdA/CDA1 family)